MSYKGVLLEPLPGADDNEYARYLASYIYDHLPKGDFDRYDIYKLICQFEQESIKF